MLLFAGISGPEASARTCCDGHVLRSQMLRVLCSWDNQPPLASADMGSLRSTPSLLQHASYKEWDVCHAMLDRGEGDVHEKDAVRIRRTRD
jgi:hypothetical protein